MKAPNIFETPDEPIGGKKFIHKQIVDWIVDKKVFDFQDMTNLPKALRDELADTYPVDDLKEMNSQHDSEDGCAKYLWQLRDGKQVESVYIPSKTHATACISSQAGCACKCVFCATGKAGPGRNLDYREIVMQFLKMEKALKTRISHVVFMGMGEPFHNYPQVIKAVEFFEKSALNLSARRITVSSIGFPKLIRQWVTDGVRAELAISLHSAFEEKRRALIPYGGLSTIDELLDAIRYHQRETKRLPTFEYVLLKDKNDQIEDAAQLVKILRNMDCKVNLIGMNGSFDGCERPSRATIDAFLNHLTKNGIKATLRRSAGRQIFAACGQLRGNGKSNLADCPT